MNIVFKFTRVFSPFFFPTSPFYNKGKFQFSLKLMVASPRGGSDIKPIFERRNNHHFRSLKTCPRVVSTQLHNIWTAMRESVNPKFFLRHIKFQEACIKTIMCLTQSLHPSSKYLDIILFNTLFIENNTSILSPEAQTILVVVFLAEGHYYRK